MKAGTAQKLVLNMITTASMIRIGKVYGNLMVDLKPVSRKLVERSKRLIRQATSCSREGAQKAFEASGRRPKLAILMILLGVDRAEAERLEEKGGDPSLPRSRSTAKRGGHDARRQHSGKLMPASFDRKTGVFPIRLGSSSGPRPAQRVPRTPRGRARRLALR